MWHLSKSNSILSEIKPRFIAALTANESLLLGGESKVTWYQVPSTFKQTAKVLI